MKKVIAVLVAVAVLNGCASTKANPVPLMQPSDARKDCTVLLRDINLTKNDIAAAQEAAAVQTRKNTIYAVTGVLVLIPAFFMDFSGAAQKEEAAAQARLEYLNGLYWKKCGNT
jgi:hypothetical protein